MGQLVTDKIKPTPTYKTTIIENLEDFQAIEAEWDELLNRSGDRALCFQPEWIIAWLKHFPPQRLHIILVRNEAGQMVGAAPFKISKGTSGITRRLLRQVQFIGTDPCVYEYMRIPYLPGEDQENILQQITTSLLEQKHLWDILDLRYFSGKEQVDILLKHLNDAGYVAQADCPMSNPYLLLPNNMETYQATRKSNFKKNIKNMLNRLQKDFPDQPLTLQFENPHVHAEQGLDNFFNRHINHWKEQGFRSDFTRFPQLRAFYRHLFKSFITPREGSKPSPFQFSILKLGEEPLSYEIGFWQGNSFLHHITSYNPAYKRYSPGMIHLEFITEYVIQHGGEALDLGRGDEAYKAHLTEAHRELWNLRVCKDRKITLLLKGDQLLKKAYIQAKDTQEKYLRKR